MIPRLLLHLSTISINFINNLSYETFSYPSNPIHTFPCFRPKSHWIASWSSLVAAGAGAAAAGYAVDYACTGLLLNWWFFVYLFKYEY